MVRTLPRGHLVHETVPTPWERKGQVMRAMVEHPPPGEVVLIDDDFGRAQLSGLAISTPATSPAA